MKDDSSNLYINEYENNTEARNTAISDENSIAIVNQQMEEIKKNMAQLNRNFKKDKAAKIEKGNNAPGF